MPCSCKDFCRMGFFSVLTKNPPSASLVVITSLGLINTRRYQEKPRHTDKETPVPGIQETDQADKCAHMYRYIHTQIGPLIHASVGVHADTQIHTYMLQGMLWVKELSFSPTTGH